MKRPRFVRCVMLGVVLAPVLVTVCHAGLGICLLRLSAFDEVEAVPVLYGRVTDFYGAVTEPTAERVRSGEVVLGGCTPGLWSHVCPFCHWPARFDPPHAH